jgi:hypothetical protein
MGKNIGFDLHVDIFRFVKSDYVLWGRGLIFDPVENAGKEVDTKHRDKK